MEKQRLIDVMLHQLDVFNNEGVDLGEDTVISEVLSDSDGEGLNSSKSLFRRIIGWTFAAAGEKSKPWPKSWTEFSAKELAGRLTGQMLLLLLLLPAAGFSQFQVNLGAAKTDLQNTAINIAVSYLRSADSAISGQEFTMYTKNGWFTVTPEINFQTGTSDAFSGITGKAVAQLARFHVTEVSGLKTPDFNRTVHLFQIAAGAETNNRFDFANAIAEVGYQPWYWSASRNIPDWIKHTRIGVFLQGGYKFPIDSASGKPIGGQVDESAEDLHSALLRAKGNFSVDIKALQLSGLKIGLVGNSTFWRDLVNNEWYYQVSGVGRIYLTPTLFFDVIYQKGSGAPNFNQGDQWSTGLTVQF